MLQVLVVTDSRGSNLEAYLKGEDSPDPVEDLRKLCRVKVKVFKGADLQRLENKITTLARDTNYDLILIIGGICSLTTRSKERGLSLLHYISQEERLASIKDTITRLDSTYKEKIHIARIPPACLRTYFSHFNKGQQIPGYLTDQQEDLLRDIQDINDHITTINVNRHQERIDLDAKLLVQSCKTSKTRSGRRRKKRPRTTFQGELLIDGVHATRDLEEKWYRRIAGTLYNWATKQEVVDTSFTSESDDPDTWRFKRPKRRRNSRH